MAPVPTVRAALDAGVQGDGEAQLLFEIPGLEVLVLMECCLAQKISHLPVGSPEV